MPSASTIAAANNAADGMTPLPGPLDAQGSAAMASRDVDVDAARPSVTYGMRNPERRVLQLPCRHRPSARTAPRRRPVRLPRGSASTMRGLISCRSRAPRKRRIRISAVSGSSRHHCVHAVRDVGARRVISRPSRPGSSSSATAACRIATANCVALGRLVDAYRAGSTTRPVPSAISPRVARTRTPRRRSPGRPDRLPTPGGHPQRLLPDVAGRARSPSRSSPRPLRRTCLRIGESRVCR